MIQQPPPSVPSPIAPPAEWALKLLYDGQCPVCAREVAVLRRRNGAGALAFEDLSLPSFDPARYGLTLSEVVGTMCAIRADGTTLKGIDVFAEAYQHVGWGWLAAPLRWRLTRPFARIAYAIFARVRPSFSAFRPESHPCATSACRRPE